MSAPPSITGPELWRSVASECGTARAITFYEATVIPWLRKVALALPSGRYETRRYRGRSGAIEHLPAVKAVEWRDEGYTVLVLTDASGADVAVMGLPEAPAVMLRHAPEVRA